MIAVFGKSQLKNNYLTFTFQIHSRFITGLKKETLTLNKNKNNKLIYYFLFNFIHYRLYKNLMYRHPSQGTN